LSLKPVCEQLQYTRGQLWDRFPPPFDKGGYTTDSSLTVLACLQGLEAAYKLNWFPSVDQFSIQEWKLLRKKFDASWLIPGEILALGDPSVTAGNPQYPELLSTTNTSNSSESAEHGVNIDDVCNETSSEDGIQLPSTSLTISATSSPQLYKASTQELHRCRSSILCTDSLKDLEENTFAEFFTQAKIGMLVRLNFTNECAEQSCYQYAFKSCSIRMVSFEFTDGCAPPAGVTTSFLNTVKEFQQTFHDGGLGASIAIHCKGGLGRTASIVGAYAMQNHGISPEAFHGWVRMCRPGSVQTVAQERYLRMYKTQKSQRNAPVRLRPSPLNLPSIPSMPARGRLLNRVLSWNSSGKSSPGSRTSSSSPMSADSKNRNSLRVFPNLFA